MIPKIATSAVKPATGPISSFAIWPSDLPSRRMEAQRITKSCTAPPSATPTMIQMRARQKAELRGERRADERAGAGDRGEVMAEDDPAVRRHEVAAVVEPLGRRRARRVEREDLRPR